MCDSFSSGASIYGLTEYLNTVNSAQKSDDKPGLFLLFVAHYKL